MQFEQVYLLSCALSELLLSESAFFEVLTERIPLKLKETERHFNLHEAITVEWHIVTSRTSGSPLCAGRLRINSICARQHVRKHQLVRGQSHNLPSSQRS